MHPTEPLPRAGEGFVLRRLTLSDLAAFLACRRDPVLARYQSWTEFTDEQTAAFLTEMNACPLLQPGAWSQIAIADADTAQLIGDIGLLLSEDGTQVEIGFTLAPAAQGRGIGTAAVRLAIALVFERTAARRVIGIADSRNDRSIRLLNRVGMRRVDVSPNTFRGEPCVEYTFIIERDARS